MKSSSIVICSTQVTLAPSLLPKCNYIHQTSLLCLVDGFLTSSNDFSTVLRRRQASLALFIGLIMILLDTARPPRLF